MLEIIAVTLEEVIQIEKLGATQIELISGFAEGGLTPSYGLIENSLKNVNIPINVMLRPHSRSFTYSLKDLEVMKTDAIIMNKIGVKNIVVGILNDSGLPDLKALDYITEGTDVTITFHRAFDSSSDLLKSIEILKGYNKVKTILTSGGIGKATDNIYMLKKIIDNRGDMNILIGSGINLENMDGIQSILENPNYHIGTAVRNNNFNNKISESQLLKAVEIYNNLKRE